jgi:hypothetical protein
MIKIIQEEGLKFITIKGTAIPVISLSDSKNITCIYRENILILDMEGKIVSKEKLTENKIAYYKDDVCHRPDIFLNNKRKCNPCHLILVCGCHLNIERGKIQDYLKKLEEEKQKPPIEIETEETKKAEQK